MLACAMLHFSRWALGAESWMLGRGRIFLLVKSYKTSEGSLCVSELIAVVVSSLHWRRRLRLCAVPYPPPP
jgi:hypothetical protein